MKPASVRHDDDWEAKLRVPYWITTYVAVPSVTKATWNVTVLLNVPKLPATDAQVVTNALVGVIDTGINASVAESVITL